MKKGELSMTMIIGAVIAIVILVIIIFLVVRNLGSTNSETACPSKGGFCSSSYCTNGELFDNGNRIACPDSGDNCCRLTPAIN